MGRLLAEEFRLFVIPAADGFIGCDAPEAAVPTVEVVMHEPALQVCFHLLCTLVMVLFGGVRLDQTISSLH